MQSRAGHTVTSPTPLSAEPGVHGSPASAGLDRNEMLVAGIIGEQLSVPLAVIDQVVQEFSRTRRITRTHLQQLRESIDAARGIAMQSQQVARLAGGRLRQSHERLSLDAIVNHALEERAKVFRRNGLELTRKIRAVDIIVDPGLLSSLVDTAIDWVSQRCQRLSVTLEIKNWPEHGMLVLKASHAIATADGLRPGDEAPEEISWYLLRQIAQTMGVTLNRLTAAGEITLVIEFARTVKQLEGLSAVEVDVGGDSSIYSESKPLAGHRVLLISPDEALRGYVKSISRGMGLVMDAVPSSHDAVRFCERDMPHMIIVDERVRDATFDELRQDLGRYDPNLPFVEVANESNTLEMASWISGSMTRVSRDSIRSQLPSILVFELAKVM